jgi:hypothetical protein
MRIAATRTKTKNGHESICVVPLITQLDDMGAALELKRSSHQCCGITSIKSEYGPGLCGRLALHFIEIAAAATAADAAVAAAAAAADAAAVTAAAATATGGATADTAAATVAAAAAAILIRKLKGLQCLSE